MRRCNLKSSNINPKVLSIFIALGIVPLFNACDDPSKPEQAESEKESKNGEEVAEEAAGVEAAKDAIKKKDEEEAKENEARYEKKLATESNHSPGTRRR
jgi:hypothetical protein